MPRAAGAPPASEPLGTVILAGIIAVDNAFVARTRASLF
ncbi:hypothetical protein FHS23_002976 [Prauserella isguenensis]|uniref:Uncharacterized protein n=1 Tax=Prauserella isguenensis TaxID=1470180 RepID=A0A839S5L1_9PSEU|nr:hypothetical protein [Prauserella isguenensis]